MPHTVHFKALKVSLANISVFMHDINLIPSSLKELEQFPLPRARRQCVMAIRVP